MKNLLKIAMFLPFILLLASHISFGEVVPDFINYQGRLTESDGTPLDGIHEIAFSLWDDSTSGTEMWAETLSVEVTDGLLNVNLGWINELTVDICGGIDPWFIPYLQIEVAGEAITPRMPLGKSLSSFTTQRVQGDITTAPGEVTVSDKVQITTSPTSAEVMIKSGNGDEALALAADNLTWPGLNIIGAAGDTVAQYNPDGMVFNTIGPPMMPVASFHPTHGIMFANETSGDTAAQYGPGEMVMVQLQPEPPGPSEFTRMGPGSLVLGIDPLFDKRMAEVCNTGLILTDSATGDTAAQYGPGEMVMVQLQPEPPGPSEFTRMGPGSLVLGIDPWFDKIMAEVCNEGLILTDSGSGDTTAQYAPNEVLFKDYSNPDTSRFSFFSAQGFDVFYVDNEEHGMSAGFNAENGITFSILHPSPPELTAAAFHPIEGIIFVDTVSSDTVAQFTPEHVQFTGEGTKTELSNLWFEMRDAGDTESAFVGTSPSEITFTRQFATYPEITTAEYGNEGVTITDTSGDYSVRVMGNTEEVTHGVTESEAMLGGNGVSFYYAPTTGGGTASGFTSESMIFSTTSATSDDTTVIISTGGIAIDTAAGSTKTIGAGEYYKDNAIVAWARVNSGATSVVDFGVTSVARTTAGYYTIVIDASLSSGNSLIPMVMPEIDTQPTGASSVRLASVNQTSTSNTFEVFINDGNYAPVDNDFVFMVTGR